MEIENEKENLCCEVLFLVRDVRKLVVLGN